MADCHLSGLTNFPARQAFIDDSDVSFRKPELVIWNAELSSTWDGQLLTAAASHRCPRVFVFFVVIFFKAGPSSLWNLRMFPPLVKCSYVTRQPLGRSVVTRQPTLNPRLRDLPRALTLVCVRRIWFVNRNLFRGVLNVRGVITEEALEIMPGHSPPWSRRSPQTQFNNKPSFQFKQSKDPLQAAHEQFTTYKSFNWLIVN